MHKTKKSNDKDLLDVDAALRRAAINAKKLAEQQGTPYVVYKIDNDTLPKVSKKMGAP